MSFRFVFVILLFFPLASAQGQSAKALSTLRKSLSEEIGGTLFARCLAAVEIADAASGEVLFAQNEQLLLRPASTAKIFPSAAAVLALPADFHFETRLLATDSTKRTLLCVGGGDPLFSEQDIQKLAEIAYAADVRHIDTLRMDDGLYAGGYYGHGWMWDDEADPFTPYLNAFSIAGNTATVSVRRSAKHHTGLDIRLSPSSDLFTVVRESATQNATEFLIERLPRSNQVRIHGMPEGGGTVRRRISIWRPQDLFADLLLRAFRQRGISADSAVIVFSPSPDAAHGQSAPMLLGGVRRPLGDALDAMNKNSNNLSAEAVLRALPLGSGKASNGIRAEDGLSAMEDIFRNAGIATGDIVLRDGSGISFYNLVSASAIGRVLRAMTRHAGAERYRASLAVAGKDGTMRNRLKSHPSALIQAKTGTVRGVSALSGYVQAPGGRLLTFVLLMQNFAGSHSAYRAAQDRILIHCIDYSASFAPVRQPR